MKPLVETIDGYEVTFDFFPAERGRRERSGLQLEPDWDASIEIISIQAEQGSEILLTEDENDAIVEQLFELLETRASEQNEPDYDDC